MGRGGLMGDSRRRPLEQLKLPLLWPDKMGMLTLPPPSGGQLSASHLRRWLPWPPVARVSRLSLPRSSSLSLWLLVRKSGAVSSFAGKESHFENWLSDVLLSEDFHALSVSALLARAENDLQIERVEAIRMLARVTGTGGKFRSEGGIVTIRDEQACRGHSNRQG